MPTPQQLQAQFTRPDGSIDQDALFAALMAEYANYNPEGDPSLGSNVVLPYGYTGGNQGYGDPSGTNIGTTMPGWGDTYHFNPGENPYFGFGDGRDIFFSADPNAIDQYQHDERTRVNQGIATVAALVGGGAAASAAGGGAAASGGAATPATTGAATTYPYAAGGAITGSAIPGVTSATTAANAAAAGIGPIAGAGAGVAGALDQSTQGPPIPSGGGSNIPNVGGAVSGLNWADIVPSIVSGLTGVLGANANANSSQAALDLAREMFDTQRADNLPTIETGNRAVGVLDAVQGLTTGTPDMSRFYNSPDYAYNLAETTKAGERALGSMGLRQSGAMVKEAQRNASGLASREYGSFVDRLLATAGLGTTGAAQSAAAGSNFASIGGNALQNKGAARSSGYGAVNNAVQGGFANTFLRQYLNRMGP